MGCDAVGVVPGSLYKEELAAGSIVRLPIETPEIRGRFAAIVQKKYLKSPGVKTFTKYLDLMICQAIPGRRLRLLFSP